MGHQCGLAQCHHPRGDTARLMQDAFYAAPTPSLRSMHPAVVVPPGRLPCPAAMTHCGHTPAATEVTIVFAVTWVTLSDWTCTAARRRTRGSKVWSQLSGHVANTATSAAWLQLLSSQEHTLHAHGHAAQCMGNTASACHLLCQMHHSLPLVCAAEMRHVPRIPAALSAYGAVPTIVLGSLQPTAVRLTSKLCSYRMPNSADSCCPE